MSRGLRIPSDLSGRVIVVTGASSGIGRASAYACAERGATVVMAARSTESLQSIVAPGEDIRGDVHVVPTDVADSAAVERLARTAHEQHGRIDAWINNAAIMAYGMFEDMPADVYRRVIEVNFLGYVHGARAVLPYFRAQGHGILINVASLYSKLSSPYVGPYVASKHAIRGFAECLRQELVGAADIHICTIFPGAVDTPIFRHVANYTGRRVTALPPVINPDRVVRAILACLANPVPETTIGETARLLSWGHAALPRLYDRLAPPVMDRVAFDRETAGESTGNVFTPMPAWNQVDGRWREKRATKRNAVTAAGVAALALPAITWLARRTKRSRS